jgi:hypothetical protein
MPLYLRTKFNFKFIEVVFVLFKKIYFLFKREMYPELYTCVCGF